jgi:RNA polymerase sigma-70 factor, ECF subfamily
MMTNKALETSRPLMTGSSSVSDWVREAKQGNRWAFNQLIDHFHKDIFRMVFYRIRSRPDAEDITQDIFLQAFKSIAQLKTIEYFKAWLYRIAVNRIRDFYRKKRFLSLVGLFSENENFEEDELNDAAGTDSSPLEEILRKEFWRKFEKAMGNLSRMEKEVFILRFLDQQGIREIAEILKKNESTVKTHLYRGLVKIQKNDELKNLFVGG